MPNLSSTGNPVGAKPVIVTTTVGPSDADKTVTYTAGPSITDTSGTMWSGKTITINGSNLGTTSDDISIRVSSTSYSCTSIAGNSTTRTCILPSLSAGTKTLTVYTAYGYASTSITYVEVPSVTSISPNIASTIPGANSGPAFSIVGTGFTAATSVTIGGVACSNFTIVSSTYIACTGPTTGLSPGAKPVVVTNSGGDSDNDKVVTYYNTAYPTLQSATKAACPTTAAIYRDTRDSQLYYTKKMADGKCWMVDNLKYAGYGTRVNSGYLTVNGNSGNAATGNYDVAKYVDPVFVSATARDYCTGTAKMPANTVTKCGYLYNWYAATYGTGLASITNDVNVTGSICPNNNNSGNATSTGAGWRVPMEIPSAPTNLGDFYSLDVALGGTGGGRTDSNTEAYLATRWIYSGAWQGIYIGGYGSGLSTLPGVLGAYWTSKAGSPSVSSDEASILEYRNDIWWFHPTSTRIYKRVGESVRCVLP
jgi:hypothetical protein